MMDISFVMTTFRAHFDPLVPMVVATFTFVLMIDRCLRSLSAFSQMLDFFWT